MADTGKMKIALGADVNGEITALVGIFFMVSPKSSESAC